MTDQPPHKYSDYHQQKDFMAGNAKIMERSLANLPPIEDHWAQLVKTFERVAEAIRRAFPDRKWEYELRPPQHQTFHYPNSVEFEIQYSKAINYYINGVFMDIRDFTDADYTKLHETVNRTLRGTNFQPTAGWTPDEFIHHRPGEPAIFEWFYRTDPAQPEETRWNTRDTITIGGGNFMDYSIETGLYLPREAWNEYHGIPSTTTPPTPTDHHPLNSSPTD